ncbi:MAG: hypothetical protein LBT33_00205 [Spirochaetia bacterium]|jgi:hypothetical protein|nr:hypothetical protein [Spirochaetia bacterium]
MDHAFQISENWMDPDTTTIAAGTEDTSSCVIYTKTPAFTVSSPGYLVTAEYRYSEADNTVYVTVK